MEKQEDQRPPIFTLVEDPGLAAIELRNGNASQTLLRRLARKNSYGPSLSLAQTSKLKWHNISSAHFLKGANRRQQIPTRGLQDTWLSFKLVENDILWKSKYQSVSKRQSSRRKLYVFKSLLTQSEITVQVRMFHSNHSHFIRAWFGVKRDIAPLVS